MDRYAWIKLNHKKRLLLLWFLWLLQFDKAFNDANDSNAAIGTHSKGGREFASCQKLLHTVDARRSHSLRACVAWGLSQFKMIVVKCKASTDGLQKISTKYVQTWPRPGTWVGHPTWENKGKQQLNIVKHTYNFLNNIFKIPPLNCHPHGEAAVPGTSEVDFARLAMQSSDQFYSANR